MDVVEILNKLVSYAKLEKDELGESPDPLRLSVRNKWTDRERMVCAECGKPVALLTNLERHNKTNCNSFPKNLQLKEIPDYARIQEMFFTLHLHLPCPVIKLSLVDIGERKISQYQFTLARLRSICRQYHWQS